MKIKEILENDDVVRNPRISYSKVARFDKEGPKALVEKTKLTGIAISQGKLIDDIIAGVDIKSKYYVLSIPKPTAQLGTLADAVVNWEEKDINNKEILKYVKEFDYWSNIKDDAKKILRFDNEEFWDYVDEMKNSKDKDIINALDLLEAREVATTLKTHNFSKHHYINDYENIYQYKIEFSYNNFNFLGYIDLLSIDHQKKRIYMKDLKTGTDPSIDFQKSFLKWRYYLQACIYSLAHEKIMKDLKLKGYKLMPFQFIYISRFEKKPLTWVMTPEWEAGALHGFNHKGYTYRGLNELLREIEWHSHNKLYDYPMDVYLKKGSLFFNTNFLTINASEV